MLATIREGGLRQRVSEQHRAAVAKRKVKKKEKPEWNSDQPNTVFFDPSLPRRGKAWESKSQQLAVISQSPPKREAALRPPPKLELTAKSLLKTRRPSVRGFPTPASASTPARQSTRRPVSASENQVHQRAQVSSTLAVMPAEKSVPAARSHEEHTAGHARSLPVAHLQRGPAYAWREEKPHVRLPKQATEMPGAALVRRHVDVFTNAILDNILEDVAMHLTELEQRPVESEKPVLKQATDKLTTLENVLCAKYGIPIDPSLRLEGHAMGSTHGLPHRATSSPVLLSTSAQLTFDTAPQEDASSPPPFGSTQLVSPVASTLQQAPTSLGKLVARSCASSAQSKNPSDTTQIATESIGALAGSVAPRNAPHSIAPLTPAPLLEHHEVQRKEDEAEAGSWGSARSFQIIGGNGGANIVEVIASDPARQFLSADEPGKTQLRVESKPGAKCVEEDVVNERQNIPAVHIADSGPRATRIMHVSRDLCKRLDLYRYRFKQHCVAAREGSLDGTLKTWNIWPSLATDILDDVITAVAREMDEAVSESVDQLVVRETEKI